MPIRVDLARTFTNSTANPAPIDPDTTAPEAAYTVGTEVGVPTGTVLTATSGLPAADASETFTITHPVTAATADLSVSVWQNRSWSSMLELGGFLGPIAGNTYLFRNCLFSSTADFRALEVLDSAATPGTQMSPLVILKHCTVTGNDALARALVAGAVWLEDCHVTGAEDAWGGGYWSVAIRSNFIATTDGSEVDPHQDGFQMAGVGLFTGFQCWFDAGPDPITNSAFRAGTDFSPIDDVGLYYSTFARGGYNVQLRGDAGGRGITDVRFVGCRWLPGAGFGPVDAVDVEITEWSDNAYLGGAEIENPAPS
jgi:hypothetical protein